MHNIMSSILSFGHIYLLKVECFCVDEVDQNVHSKSVKIIQKGTYEETDPAE